jgi:hypothetical protein
LNGRTEEKIAFYRGDVEKGLCLEIEPFTFIYPGQAYEDKYLPHHYSDEAEARQLLADFEIESFDPVGEVYVGERGGRQTSLHYYIRVRRPDDRDVTTRRTE